VVTFLSFLAVGMAPLFSPFMVAVLEEIALHLVHLIRNTVLSGAILAFFPLPGGTSGRTGIGTGCTSRWTTLPPVFVFVKSRRHWAWCGGRC